MNRRGWIRLAAAAATAGRRLRAARWKTPIAAELWCVREELKKDLSGTLKAIAVMGYDAVEFSGAYFDYTLDRAREIRSILDGLGLKCVGTHNSPKYFTGENLPRAIELNSIVGGKQLIQASAPDTTTASAWRAVADNLNRVSEALRPHGMRTGYHNHAVEFQPVEGAIPWEIVAANTSTDVILQLDLGFITSVGRDPVDLIKRHPGRMRSVHVKDYSLEAGRGFRVVFGEGSVKWREVFRATETIGGIEHYIIEQDATYLSPLETMEKSLHNMKRLWEDMK